MKKTGLLLICALFCLSAYGQTHTVWQIGKQDNSAAEFALASDGKGGFLADFGGENTVFSIGYSTPQKHWPYLLPGPLDSWAGGGYWSGFYPRHFPRIVFNLKDPVAKGSCRLLIDFQEVNAKQPTVLRVEINGHRRELDLPAGKGTTVSVEIPENWLKKGLNTIQMGMISGSWASFDDIRMEGSRGLRIEDISSSLVLSAKAASFELKQGNKRVQPLLVDIIQMDKEKAVRISIAGLPSVTKTIEKGHAIIEIPMPAVAGAKQGLTSAVAITSGNKTIYRGTITRSRQNLQTYADYVDLLMGTGNSRWMFKPGPSLPLSMVQIAPDNQDETWKAGYEYSVENIMGFSHFSDWTMCGLLTMPTSGRLQVNPGTEKDPDGGYRSRIDKKTESAQIGKYSVFMTDTRIKAEITSTRRASLQRYTFPALDSARILVDLFTPNEYPHNLKAAKITKVSDSEIEGFATYDNAFTGYSLEQLYTVHFVMQFSKPFQSMGGWVNNEVKPVTGYIGSWNRTHEFDTQAAIRTDIDAIQGKGDLGVFLNFKTNNKEAILVRTGVSLVDLAGARNNLEKEMTGAFGWDFEKVVQNARTIWNEYLGRIQIETDDYLQKKKFYTNLYRAVAAKAIWSDVDGRYVDEEEKIRQFKNKEDCIVSGEYWNTFWNNQQLFNLVTPEISSKWARSAIELYQNSGWFNTDPAGVEHTGVMVAMHGISQIQGAWQSGIRDFDLDAAYRGFKKMLTTPPQHAPGGGTVGVEDIQPYMKYGYVPSGMGSVSNTMEYAYDDWCLAQMALVLNKKDDHAYFDKRSENWKNVFDKESGFARPKDKEGNWLKPFDPYHTPGFVEGNAFNYTWFVPHRPEELIFEMGKERFVGRLNEAMEKSAAANFNASGDDFSSFPINHGNEPAMQVSYLFNWAGKPWLSQKWNRAIQEQYYGTTPYDAYPGDEDLGQMSSWFIMSAIGLFQMDGGCSAQPVYEIGSPRYPRITILLNHKYNRGAKFIIEARKASKEHKYIQSAKLNGKPIADFRILQKEVLKGGILELQMGREPNEEWGVLIHYCQVYAFPYF
ncbi:hypothetical protein DBR43_29185 [Pedobacter sp. KBW06]|nr:hypothetical protein DBR43_29185 [Pedobacter sp. KBW06]